MIQEKKYDFRPQGYRESGHMPEMSQFREQIGYKKVQQQA
jgi:hypothetical protein